MNRRPALYVVASQPVRGNVVPFRLARRLPRETAWRDLVRRLAKFPEKH